MNTHVTRWPIERSWVVLTSKDVRVQVPSSALLNYRACGMLGAAGLGKTYELEYLADLDRQRGLDVRLKRLVVLGQTVDGLATQLDNLVAGATEDSVIYLDALDEVMIPVKTAGLAIQSWIRDKLPERRPALRISCRSAVWPNGVRTAISEVYGEDNCAVAQLQPLSTSDVTLIASSRHLDAVAFLAAIEAARALTLSQQPLTLEMLLRIYEDHGALPTSCAELFAQGTRRLAADRDERLEAGTLIDIPLGDILDAAERLACFCLLSGRETIDLSDWPTASSLGRLEIEGLPGGRASLNTDLIRSVGRCGLCDSDSPLQFRFAHRQFAEYLAGRRVAKLLLHQAQALLRCDWGWQAGVAGPLRETAAFAAIESKDIAQWLVEYDPEVVGLSNVADDVLRKQATQKLLSKFRTHELTDVQVGWGDKIELAGFQYAGAERDLRAVLQERSTGCDDVLECAIDLIESWNLVDMSDDLANLMLDENAPFSARKEAGYALAKIGTPEAKRKTLPLTADCRDDANLDLKGLALRCNWPEGMTVPDLLKSLVPPRVDNYHGAYDGFLLQLDESGFDARGFAIAGLAWAKQFAGRQNDYEHVVRIARRIAIASLDDLDRPGVADALADLIIDAAHTYSDSPLTQPRPIYSWDRKEDVAEPAPVLLERSEERRKLLDTLAAREFEKFKLWHAAEATPGLLTIEDFPWLLERATSSAFSMQQRANYVEFAWAISWGNSVSCIEAWLAVRDLEPVASRMPYPICMELDSEEAAKARKSYEEEMERKKRSQEAKCRKKLSPAPAERVKEVLTFIEAKDSSYFFRLCQELTLVGDSTHYGFSRFLTRTPGWAEAMPATRVMIVDLAKRLLADESDEPERIRSVPLNTGSVDYMAALWLVLEREPAWLDTLPRSWWRRWAWYILRELRPHSSDESEEPKVLLLRALAHVLRQKCDTKWKHWQRQLERIHVHC